MSSEFVEAAAPLLAALKERGLPTEGFGVFRTKKGDSVLGAAPAFDYERSVPVLLEWLPQIDDPHVKEAIVRSLATRHARGVATPILIQERRPARSSVVGRQCA
jgi:hypothetical protein